MATSTATATWNGDLKSGKGEMKTGNGGVNTPFSFKTRFEGEKGTNPEELIGAALAGCYSMALSHGLASAGHVPTQVTTDAKVTLSQVEGGFAITTIHLTCNAQVPGIDNAKFQEVAEATKKGCPVSKALTGTKIELSATLK